MAALARSYAAPVWALPRSLAATEGILSFPRGTEMFQFPRFPPGYFRVASHHACRVAPFGDLWIAGCQRLPRAFRRVATSFIGVQRQGIHRVPIIPVAPFAIPSIQPASFPAGTSRQSRAIGCLKPMADVLVAGLRAGPAEDWRLVLLSPARLVPGGPIRIVPFSCQRASAGGAAGARTPNLRRARAALSRLSYDPVKRAGGRTWTRTRDLGLIRAAL